eukprot:1149563-Pelagomonas_calceolata.AAC.5
MVVVLPTPSYVRKRRTGCICFCTHTRTHTHIATNTFSSLHQLRKQILYSEKHRHHVQGDVLKFQLGMNADTIAKYQASPKDNNLTNTDIPRAGLDGNAFCNVAWLARREARPSASASSSPIFNLMYFPDLEDALKSGRGRTSSKHRPRDAIQSAQEISSYEGPMGSLCEVWGVQDPSKIRVTYGLYF